MPPPRQACDLYATAALIRARILKKLQDLMNIVQKIIEIKAQILYGIVNLSDIVGAEFITAISSVASQLAQQLLGAVSKMASAILEAILASLLKILLANPTAIFSLVAIQQERCLLRANRERKYLMRARSNVRVILAIIRKWSEGIGGAKFFGQIKNALPYIEIAIQAADDLVQGLEGEPTIPGQQRNAVFDENKYRRLRGAIQSAIDITNPQSILTGQSQITSLIQSRTNELYRDKSIKVNAAYKEKQRSLTKWYQEELAKIDVSSQTLRVATQQEKLRGEYSSRRTALDTQKKLDLEAARLEASAQATFDGSSYVKAAKNVQGEFSYDVQVLMQNLGDFVENTKDAYLNHKASQIICRSIYKSRDLIRKLIEQVIGLLRGIGNEAGDLIIRALEGSVSLLEMTREDFQDIVDRYTSANGDVGSVEMAANVARGNGMLVVSDAILQASVSGALIDLINSDDVLQDADGLFNKWIERIGRIPDWDGEENVWAVSIIRSKTPPYLGMIADAVRLMRKAPRLMVSKRQRSKEKLQKLIRDLDNDFKTVTRHNGIVVGILDSYKPYMASEAGNLKRILAMAGLLEAFSIGMSITGLISGLASMAIKYDIDDNIPTYRNCKASYPDLFTDPDIGMAAAVEQWGLADPLFLNNYQTKLESGDAAVENVLGARENVDSYNPDASIVDDDLLDNSESDVA